MKFPILATYLVVLTSAVHALPPSVLRCENRVEPLGVEVSAPRFSWQLQAGTGETNKSQSAYHILVASTKANLAAGIGDLWDSGKVSSSASKAIRYAGPALASLQTAHWKVRAWDEADQPTAWSAPASWTMGMLEPGDWLGASWIGTPDTSTPLGYAVESATADAVKWVQVDLGTEVPLDSVVIRPQYHSDPAAGGWIEGYGFPIQFKVEVSNVADFSSSTMLADRTGSDFRNPGNTVVSLNASGVRARYVRCTATQLWQRGPGLNYVFTLAEIEAISGASNVALGKAVSANDSYEGSGWSKDQLTDGKWQQPLPQVLSNNPNAAILLRKPFSIAKPVKRALAAIGTVGWSELTVNGTKAGDAQLSPEYTDYRKRVPYVMQDVTASVQQGDNVLGVTLANGFAATPGGGYLGWYGRAKPARVLLRLLVEFTDGSSQTVVSDGSWKWNIGENTFNDLWVGEKLDNRLAKNGWDAAGYLDTDWFAASLLDTPAGTLFARTMEPVRILETATPTSINGNLFLFDHVATGWLRLKTSGSAGDTVTVLQRGDFPTGFGASGGMEGPQVGMQCTLSGSGEETFEPKWYFHTISKTVRVEGLTAPATPDTLTRVSVGIDLPRAGNFECSNAFLNEQYQILLRTQRNYNFDYPMDPTREKTGWSQDVMGMIHTSVYDFDAEEFYWNWWKSMRDTQQAGGYLDPVMPQIDVGVPRYNGPWWAGMIVYTPWWLYTYYGDQSYLEQAYPAMKSFMDYLATQADADKVVSWGLGDWIEVGSTSFPTRTAVPITSTCAYYLYATILQRSAEILGNTADAASYSVLATQIKDGFNRRFVNASTGQVGGNADSQTAQILPLYLGMIPEETKQQVLGRLVANIHERGDHVSTGFVGNIHLLLGLPELGQAELTHTIVTQRHYPGWNTLVQDGVQKETWKGGLVQMPSLGGPMGAYLYQILGGIRPAEPGFKKVLIKPAMVGDLTFVNTHHDGPYGRIVSNWRKENGQFILDTTVPPNSTATVVLPDGSSHEVGSGSWQFTMALPVSPRTAEPSWDILSICKVEVGQAGMRWENPVVEPRPGCGLVKNGTGTLVVKSDLKLSGVINVQQGILDLTDAKLPPGLRFNIAEGAGLKLPRGKAIPCDMLFFSDEKQAAGKWGGKGSVAAKQADFESPAISGGTLVVKDTGLSARERWKRMKYGLFVHYVNDGSGHTTFNIDGSPTSAGADYVAGSFDAKGFAEDVASMGVEYLIFTAWHSNFHPLFNSAAVERIPPNERPRINTPKSDMLGRMVSAVRAKGIRVLFYSHPGQQNFWGEDWNRFMEDIYGEMLDRYDIDGFYVDENDPGGNSDRNIDFHRIERAVRWRKPDAVMVQNFYGNLYAFDAPMGESGPASPDFSPNIGWTMPNAYAQVISKTWSAHVPKVPTLTPAVTRSPEGIFRATVVGAGSCVEGGGWAWAAGPYPGDGTWTDPATGQKKFVGRWEEGVLEAMQKAGKYIAPIAESIKQTYPSTSWQPQGSISNLPWGVATRSPDDKTEYVHVLNPQPDRSLALPPPDDGKTFANARLLPGGKPVKLEQSQSGVRLTLPEGESWNPLDTVIAMDVTGEGSFRSRVVRADDPAVIYGTREVFNDNVTQPGGAGWIEYQGNWPGQWRDSGEYQSDIHYTAADGDAFIIHFNGTGVMMVGNGMGEIDFSLDGKPLKRVNMNASGNRPHVVGIDLTGLPNGKHELKGVKVGGPYVQVDMFRVYNPAGGNWKRTGPNNSLRTTDRNEDFVQFLFTGTAVQFLAPQGPDRATIEVFLDGQSVRHINQYHGTPQSTSPLVTLANLPRGRHTLCLVKTRGGFMNVGACRVFQHAG